jgi:hypothetical protein
MIIANSPALGVDPAMELCKLLSPGAQRAYAPSQISENYFSGHHLVRMISQTYWRAEPNFGGPQIIAINDLWCFPN